MLNIKVDGEAGFVLTTDAGEILLNKQHVQSDIVPFGDAKFHMIIDNRSVNIELLKKDDTGKTMEILVNGVKHQVQLEDEYDRLLKKLGMDKMLTHKINDVKAPMPGLVLSVKVKEGDVVKKGDPLLVLEAMKMENIIKSPADAVVLKVNVNEKTAVEKNQVLLVME